MTHVKIEIDDAVEFDGSVTEWKRQPPDMFRDQIRPDATPKPWMKAIMVTMAEGIMAKRSMHIVAYTMPVLNPKADGWTVQVIYR